MNIPESSRPALAIVLAILAIILLGSDPIEGTHADTVFALTKILGLAAAYAAMLLWIPHNDKKQQGKP